MIPWDAGVEAAGLIDRGRHEEALRVLRRARAHRFSWGLLLRSRARARQGHARLTEADVTRAYDLDPSCGWVCGFGPAPRIPGARRLARANRRAGSSAGAYAVLSYEAKLAAMSGRIREALGLFDLAVAKKPPRGQVFAWRAEARRRAGDEGGARSDCERALRLDPREPVARVCRARLRLAAGDAEGALDDAARVSRSSRGYEEAPLEAARACLAMGRAAAALRWLDAAQRRANRYGWRSLGSQAGEQALARMESDAALRAAIPRAAYLSWRAEWELSQGRAAAALRFCDEAILLDGGRALAWTVKGESLAALGRRGDARACLDRSLGLRPRQPRAALARGLLLLEDGRAAAAERDFTRALQDDPTWTSVLLARSRARRALGEEASAREDALAVLRLAPRGSKAREAAAAYLRGG